MPLPWCWSSTWKAASASSRPATSFGAFAGALELEQLFDSVALRIDGPRAWDEHLAIDWIFSDLGRTIRTTLTNGVLSQTPDPPADAVDLTITLTKTRLFDVLLQGELDGVDLDGDPTVIARLQALLDRPEPSFPIVTP